MMPDNHAKEPFMASMLDRTRPIREAFQGVERLARAGAATAERAAYVAAQGARVAWYMGHYVAARRLSGPVQRPGDPRFQPKAKPGDPVRIRAAFLDLFTQDRANIEAGLYAAPGGFSLPALLNAFDASRKFFEDLPAVDARRLARDGVEVRAQAPTDGERYPAYFLQNFHYQSGGWLTAESAQLYDTQVEVLFGGGAAAMRRIALGEVARAMKGRDQRRTRLLDVACGNGGFLSQIMECYPRLHAAGLDLSPAYAQAARDKLKAWPQVDIVHANAEAIPEADDSIDLVSVVYLFHELPPRVRRAVAAEMARVLKPGGELIFADSLQTGDTPDLDQMLEWFPVGFHEPFYGSYLAEDLVALFGALGLQLVETKHAFLTKVIRMRKV
jgi:ubiquinone/menaquinone biosynthesis C-methylase UbiE